MQCIISHGVSSLGFSFTEFVSSEEAVFIESFLLKDQIWGLSGYCITGQDDQQQQDRGAFLRKLIDPVSG